MDIAYQPSVVDITHNPLDAVKSIVYVRGIMHGQDNSSDDHCYKDNSGQRAKIPKVIKIFRRGIFMELMLHKRKYW